MAECAVCQHDGRAVRECLVLGRHRATLHQCANCGLLYFKKPHWLAEAYSDAIVPTDTGILLRNRRASQKVSSLLLACMEDAEAKTFLDCAGGYGLFVREMRDRGFDFRWSDPYCQNLFARGFEHREDVSAYAAVTAFEVFEHVEDPLAFARDLLVQGRGADTIIFTTDLFEGDPPPPDWWYYSLDTGQHITFYQGRTLQHMARQLGMRFLSSNGFHVFTRAPGITAQRLRWAVSRWAPLLLRLKGSRLVGKADSDHHALTRRIQESRLH